MNWYPLRVISGKEGKVKENLMFELDYQNLVDEVSDILIPSENIVEMKDGKKKIKNKVLALLAPMATLKLSRKMK